MEEQQGAVGGRPTEEEMLEILSNKYEFHPKGTPYAAKQVGTKPKNLPFVSTPFLPFWKPTCSLATFLKYPYFQGKIRFLGMR
ncbi:hypothetical protein DPMN_013716 [Dreissena polymorpha]|uniref:Uncharacterized protein n=1 Tax=Dreissena polymorpha TaxID=45954 RepID=A0A9D4N5Y0_DREPO|nr:hypothetical protein DPMN_013716 [Dreissena polymorpha]